MAYNMDMYDYLNAMNRPVNAFNRPFTIQFNQPIDVWGQPVNVFTVNAPAEKKTETFLTREQARAKEIKEKEELRLWWDDLPEEKKQAVRDEQFVAKKKKKPEKKKPKPKPNTPPASDDEEDKKYAIMVYEADCNRQPKPDIKGALMTQHWAQMSM